MTIDTPVYWDTCVFLDLVQGTPDHAQSLNAIAEAAEAGRVRIVTSAFTLAEVIKTPDLGLLPPEQETLIRDFFENDYIDVVNVDRFVAEEARSIARDHNLKPPDAVHVATAVLSAVAVLHSYDEKLLKLNGIVGDAALRIETPTWPGDLRLPHVGEQVTESPDAEGDTGP